MTSVLSALLSRSWRALFIPIVVILGCPISAGAAAAQSGTWVSNGPEGGTIHALAIDPQTSSTLYAGTSGGGVFQSTDGGASWRAINTGLTIPYIRALAIETRTPPAPSAGTNVWRALYGRASRAGEGRRTVGGASWTAVNTGPERGSIHALAIDPQTPSTLYAGASCGGVFQSTDGGANWGAINTGLTKPCVGALAVDPKTPSTLYAGTSGRSEDQRVEGGGSGRAIKTVRTDSYG